MQTPQVLLACVKPSVAAVWQGAADLAGQRVPDVAKSCQVHCGNEANVAILASALCVRRRSAQAQGAEAVAQTAWTCPLPWRPLWARASASGGRRTRPITRWAVLCQASDVLLWCNDRVQQMVRKAVLTLRTSHQTSNLSILSLAEVQLILLPLREWGEACIDVMIVY